MANNGIESYTDQQRVHIAEQEYGYTNSDGKRDPYQFGQEVTIDNGTTTVGYVSQVVNDPVSGLQAYVVTDQRLPSDPSGGE